jgi:hypothetical protein
MTSSPNEIEFDYQGWYCWQNDTTGVWGAILSRKGKQPIVIDGKTSREDLLAAIDAH